MAELFAHALLAQAPRSLMYISIIKLIVLAALFLSWVLFAEWVDKDAVRVNTRRAVWNMASIFVGAASLVLLLFMPFFWASVAGYVVLFTAFAASYVVHRNSLVVEDDRVTLASLMRGGKREEKKVEVKELIALRDHTRERVPIPEDNVERQVYGAAQKILFDALHGRAGEIDLIPAGAQTRVRLKIDGQPLEREPLERTVGETLVNFFKGIAGLDLQEHRKPQKGRITAQIADHRYDTWVSTLGSTAGERLTLHVVGPEKDFKVKDLGFTNDQLDTVNRIMEAEHGVVLISALPEGGLTTTVYSFARSHDAFLQNIQMLEREHELDVDNITLVTYQPNDKRTFADELLRITRSDPDVIVLPDLGQDGQSARIAAQAANRKPTVYIGLRAVDVFDAIRRWVALVNDAGEAGKTMLGVLHQRLVRLLCPTCKAPYKPDAATLQKMNMAADQVFFRPPQMLTDKHGKPIVCEHCKGMGYVGRTAIFQVVEFNDELRGLVQKGASLNDIKAAVQKKGSISLQAAALQKVREGLTSIEEVRSATRSPEPRRKESGGGAGPAAAAQSK